MSDDATSHVDHVLPLRLYLGVGATLLILTGITVAVSFMHFGGWNLVVAMLIAATKASLVALFFMHLKYDNKLYSFIFAAALLFLAIFIIFTMFDTLRRDQIYIEKAGHIRQDAVIYDSMLAATHGADSTSVTTGHDRDEH
jgi:cytochrome c oxidase subunit 4